MKKPPTITQVALSTRRLRSAMLAYRKWKHIEEASRRFFLLHAVSWTRKKSHSEVP